MKIKNLIFEKKQYFVTIEKIHSSDQLSVMDAYRINRLVRKLTELNEEFQELKKKITDQYGTLNEEEGTITISAEDRTEFNTEYNELIDIEHDLEDEKLPFPKKIQDGFSATDLTVLEMFFDLSGLEEKPKTEDEPDNTTPTEQESE
jgi:septal ring factor EnvC (AmiA/AmiB activator)